MTTRERLYNVQEFLNLALAEENQLKRLELQAGVIVEMPPSSQKNTVVAMRIGRYLGMFVDEHDLGYVTGPDGGYQLSADTVRQPDVGFISKARHAELSGIVFPVAPDLAVEVVSPEENIVRKVGEYIGAGTRLVWTVYAEDRAVYVWRQAQIGGLHVDEYSLDDTLSGGDVLPGFTLPLRDVFTEATHDNS